jgi:peptidyl-prolyl cis-trans isomerase D
MIKWIHQNKRSITVFLVASVVVLSMSFFGVNIGRTKGERYAIKIGDEKISFEEFQKERRDRQEMLIQQYKKMLGKNYSQFAQQIYNIPNQQIADDIIAKRLTRLEADRLNLYVGEEQMQSFIRDQVFGGNFNSATYNAYLTQTGQNAPAFENKLREELLIENYRSLLSDLTEPSKKEIENFIKTKETAYDVNYVEFDPKNFEEKVKVDDAELEKYYTANQTDYEIPAKIQYNYSALNPENSMQLVDISQEDIEANYSENESRYMNPEQAKVRQIQINIPKDADKAKLDEIKKKAEEAHSKASAGEKFELLVPQYSDDFLTSTKGGDLGWITKGKKEKEFDDAVFGLKGKGIAPLIQTEAAYYIVQVEDYKEKDLKKLEEVREQIETELKKREAPAFISAKTYELYDAWEKNDKSLKDEASEGKIPYTQGGKLLAEGQDPDPKLKGLTKQVLLAHDLKKQIIDLGDNSVLVEVEKYEESRIPPFAEAKEEVLKHYKSEKSKTLAAETSQKFLESLNDPKQDFKTAAKAENLKVEEKKGLTRAKPDSGIFANKEVLNAIFSAAQPNQKPSEIINSQGKYYAVSVTAITPPDEKTIKEKYKNYEKQARDESAETLIQANLNRMKIENEIDIDKNLLAGGSNV